MSLETPALLEHLPGTVQVAKDRDELFDNLALDLASAAAEAIEARGVFHLALSGGSTPEPFYMRLMVDPRYRGFPWDRTHIWLVDERRVPPGDDRANIRMIRESLTDHAGIRSRQVHAMPALHENAAEEYEAELLEHVPESVQGPGPARSGHRPAEPPRLDFILLGMGDDAHTASLFPRSPALQETARWVAVNEGPTVTPPDRLTLTFPMINAGRRVAVLVSGAGKASALANVADRHRLAGPDPENLPITGVQPIDSELLWHLDAAAARADTDDRIAVP